MRVAFLGSAEFSIPTLNACAAEHEVVAVVTAPARAGNRGKPAPQPVADAARAMGCAVLQPERLRRDATDDLLAMELDALVVFAYGQILPQRLLDGPRFGGVNVHPSLLPRWRGASPIVSAIRAGDAETGVCIMQMEAGLDTGPVYARRTVPVPARVTAPELSATLGQIGADMISAVLRDLARGVAVSTPQGEEGLTYAPMLRREDGRIDWAELSATEVDCHVRAMQPWPGTTAMIVGESVRIMAGVVADDLDGDTAPSEPGAVVRVERDAVVVATRSGGFRITEVQPPGRRRMDAAAYWRGRRIPV